MSRVPACELPALLLETPYLLCDPDSVLFRMSRHATFEGKVCHRMPFLSRQLRRVGHPAADFVEYLRGVSYGWKHCLYLWHLLRLEEMHNTIFITNEIMMLLMRGNLHELPYSYKNILSLFGVE